MYRLGFYSTKGTYAHMYVEDTGDQRESSGDQMESSGDQMESSGDQMESSG